MTISSGNFGSGIVLDFEYDNPPNEYAADTLMPIPFQSSMYYKLVGGNTYQATEEDQDQAIGGQANAGYWKNTITPLGNSTLRWSYWWKANDKSMGQTVGQVLGALEYYQEIILRRAK